MGRVLSQHFVQDRSLLLTVSSSNGWRYDGMKCRPLGTLENVSPSPCLRCSLIARLAARLFFCLLNSSWKPIQSHQLNPLRVSSKSRFSQPFKETCMSEVVRIESIIIFHLSKLWRAKFFILCGVIWSDVRRRWNRTTSTDLKLFLPLLFSLLLHESFVFHPLFSLSDLLSHVFLKPGRKSRVIIVPTAVQLHCTSHSQELTRCVQRTPKAGLGLNTSQTTHEANDHGRHSNIVEWKRASFAKNILFRWIVWWTRQ